LGFLLAFGRPLVYVGIFAFRLFLVFPYGIFISDRRLFKSEPGKSFFSGLFIRLGHVRLGRVVGLRQHASFWRRLDVRGKLSDIVIRGFLGFVSGACDRVGRADSGIIGKS